MSCLLIVDVSTGLPGNDIMLKYDKLDNKSHVGVPTKSVIYDLGMPAEGGQSVCLVGLTSKNPSVPAIGGRLVS